MKKLGLVLALALGISGSFAAQAQVVSDPKEVLFDASKLPPFDPVSLPLLKDVANKGGQFYYIGERSGLYGFFALMSDRIQIFYVTGDRKTVLVGGIYTDSGILVSSLQIKKMLETNKQLSDKLNELAKQGQAIAGVGNAGGTASLAAGEAGGTAIQTGSSMVPTASLSPGEQLLRDMETSPGVVLGKEGAPLIHMVVLTTCPHCKATWKQMKESVAKGDVRVHLIPVGEKGTDEERMAANLILSADPLAAWNKVMDGDKKALMNEPFAEGMESERRAYSMTERWNIQNTPYIVYRSKDKHIKIVQGKPEQVTALLADVAK